MVHAPNGLQEGMSIGRVGMRAGPPFDNPPPHCIRFKP